MNDSAGAAGYGPILVAYDGSEFAKAAIAEAGRQLADGRKTIVLTVWLPLEAIPFIPVGGAPLDRPAVDAIVDSSTQRARDTAEEGVALARAAGLDAEPLVEEGDPVWRRIVAVADQHNASIIVLGSHGRTGLSYVLLGSVATSVAHHANRAVLITRAPRSGS